MKDMDINKKLNIYKKVSFSTDFTKTLFKKIDKLENQKKQSIIDYFYIEAKPAIVAASVAIVLSLSTILLINATQQYDTIQQITGLIVENSIEEVLK